MTTWERRCVLCAVLHGRDRDLTEGHVCQPCRVGLRVDLLALVDAATAAAVVPHPLSTRPGTATRRSAPGSRPPLDLAHIDPELVPVRCEADDPSSAEPLLVLLESWCRAVREDRGLAPYGTATEGRPVTLTGTVTWLARHVDWMCDTPGFAVDDFAAQVRRAHGALYALGPAFSPEPRWTIPCPSDRPEETG